MLYKIKLMSVVVLIFLNISANSLAQSKIISNSENDIRYLEDNIYKFAYTDPGIVQTDETAPLLQRMDEYNGPGLSIALINNCKLEWARAYGVLRSDSPGAVTEESIFQAASVSKFVTALIVMHYVEEGKFNLGTDVNTYLKSWLIPSNEYTETNKITLRYLLSHTSGLPSYSSTERDEKRAPPTLLQYIKGEYPVLNAPAIPEFIPGDHWAYSNIAYGLVQLILEDTFNKPLSDIADKIIFSPLGMGLGVFLDTSAENLVSLHHGHNSPGTVFLVFAIPGEGQGVAIAANGNIGDRLYLEVLAGLASLYKWESGQYFK